MLIEITQSSTSPFRPCVMIVTPAPATGSGRSKQAVSNDSPMARGIRSNLDEGFLGAKAFTPHLLSEISGRWEAIFAPAPEVIERQCP